jgi:hypothetical protein
MFFPGQGRYSNRPNAVATSQALQSESYDYNYKRIGAHVNEIRAGHPSPAVRVSSYAFYLPRTFFTTSWAALTTIDSMSSAKGVGQVLP